MTPGGTIEYRTVDETPDTVLEKAIQAISSRSRLPITLKVVRTDWPDSEPEMLEAYVLSVTRNENLVDLTVDLQTKDKRWFRVQAKGKVLLNFSILPSTT